MILVVIALTLATFKAAIRGERFMQMGTTLLQITILVTYLVLPAVTTTIFRTFDCVELDDPRGGKEFFLRAHWLTRCDPATRYGAYRAYAIVCVFLWPVGVPSMYFFELYRRRARLDPLVDDLDVDEDGKRRRDPKTVARALEVREQDVTVIHLQLLYGPYEPQFYLWEVWEMVRRLMATSMLLAFQGPISKLFFSVFLGLMTVKYYGYFLPHAPPGSWGTRNAPLGTTLSGARA